MKQIAYKNSVVNTAREGPEMTVCMCADCSVWVVCLSEWLIQL